MQLARQILDGGNNARRRAIDRIADRCITVIVNSLQQVPPWPVRDGVEIVGTTVRMGIRENQIFGL